MPQQPIPELKPLQAATSIGPPPKRGWLRRVADMMTEGVTGGEPGPVDVLLAAAPLAGVAKKGFRAFHGSPHDFDEFSLKKFGTGEGTDWEGHGLYFSEDPGSADFYADFLSRNNPKATRRRYEVDIQADPSEFLSWERPPAGSPAGEKLQDIPGEWPIQPRVDIDRFRSGRELYETLTKTAASRFGGVNSAEAVASRYLRRRGIPGLSYTPRGQERWGRNYVVTDDALINIVRKYGFVPPAVWAAVEREKMLGMMGTPQDQ